MFHNIKNVLPKEDLIIEVEFENQVKKQYDIKKSFLNGKYLKI